MSLVWRDLGLNTGLSDHQRSLKWRKIFFLSCNRGLISIILYYFQILNKKKDTTLLLEELLAVTWVQCISKLHIYIYIYIYIWSFDIYMYIYIYIWMIEIDGKLDKSTLNSDLGTWYFVRVLFNLHELL